MNMIDKLAAFFRQRTTKNNHRRNASADDGYTYSYSTFANSPTTAETHYNGGDFGGAGAGSDWGDSGGCDGGDGGGDGGGGGD